MAWLGMGIASSNAHAQISSSGWTISNQAAYVTPSSPGAAAYTYMSGAPYVHSYQGQANTQAYAHASYTITYTNGGYYGSNHIHMIMTGRVIGTYGFYPDDNRLCYFRSSVLSLLGEGAGYAEDYDESVTEHDDYGSYTLESVLDSQTYEWGHSSAELHVTAGT